MLCSTQQGNVVSCILKCVGCIAECSGLGCTMPYKASRETETTEKWSVSFCTYCDLKTYMYSLSRFRMCHFKKDICIIPRAEEFGGNTMYFIVIIVCKLACMCGQH